MAFPGGGRGLGITTYKGRRRVVIVVTLGAISWIRCGCSLPSLGWAVLRKRALGQRLTSLLSAYQVIDPVDSIEVLKERLVDESEVLSHFDVTRILLFEYGRLNPFVLYIVRGLGSPAEVLNPGLKPPLVNQVEYL